MRIVLQNKKANLVVIADDVDPIELVVFVPALCRKMGIPYVIVKNKARLGTVVHKKKAAILTLQDVRSEDSSELAKLVSAAKANFSDKYESHRREWGGGLRGNKSKAKLARRAKAAGALLFSLAKRIAYRLNCPNFQVPPSPRSRRSKRAYCKLFLSLSHLLQ
jgi:large subunit ribosomal protein L7Ae